MEASGWRRSHFADADEKPILPRPSTAVDNIQTFPLFKHMIYIGILFKKYFFYIIDGADWCIYAYIL